MGGWGFFPTKCTLVEARMMSLGVATKLPPGVAAHVCGTWGREGPWGSSGRMHILRHVRSIEGSPWDQLRNPLGDPFGDSPVDPPADPPGDPLDDLPSGESLVPERIP